MTLRTLAAALVFLASGSLGTHAQQSSVVVKIEGGLISGAGDNIRSFKGIPYAKPPVGPLRWQPPQPASSWTGALDATHFGPDCVQPAEYPELRGNRIGEDCLTINVWTPARQVNENLPVMVWVYGGGYTYGSGSHPTYDGDAFANRGVILVTFNYRMGLFGFLAHPELSAASPNRASGNYALMDIQAALQWVQKNINSFGGNPANVTVFGQSAGAFMTTSLMSSPSSKGLFAKAILQSGGVMRPMATLKEAEAYGLAAGTSLEALRAMPAEALVARLKEMEKAPRLLTSARALSPIVDGFLIKEDDRASIASDRFAAMPLIVGTVTNEGGGYARNNPVKTPADLRDLLARTFPGSTEKVVALYGADDDAKVPAQLAAIFGDTQYNFGSRELMRYGARKGMPVYRYLFSRSRNNAAAQPIHGAELQYVFDNLSASHRGRVAPSDAADFAIAAQMADAWARFAKTGDPNGGNLPQWPKHGAETENYMDFGATVQAKAGNRTAQLDFIRDFYGLPAR